MARCDLYHLLLIAFLSSNPFCFKCPSTHEYPPVGKIHPRMPCACSAVPNGRSTRPISPSTSCKPNCEAFVTTRPGCWVVRKVPNNKDPRCWDPGPIQTAEVHGGHKWGWYLEDHPRTYKWLITMVSKSPKKGCSPYKLAKWLINGGYEPLTNWDDPPSSQVKAAV